VTPVYLCDLDGTICDISHRLHFIKREKPDWDGFFRACVDDTPKMPIIRTLRALYHGGAAIVYVSGRSDLVKQETMTWLAEFGCPPGPLFMRKADDHREDHVVKAELLEEVAKIQYPGDWCIEAVFEDRKQVVEMYRKRGYTVFQVAEGDF